MIDRLGDTEQVPFELARDIAAAVKLEADLSTDHRSSSRDRDLENFERWAKTTDPRSYNLTAISGLFEKLADEAKTNRETFELLTALCRSLSQQQIAYPTGLTRFSEWVATGADKPRVGSRSRHEVRDYWISVLLRIFSGYGMARYRNAASSELSACDAIGEGFGLSYDVVAQIASRMSWDLSASRD